MSLEACNRRNLWTAGSPYLKGEALDKPEPVKFITRFSSWKGLMNTVARCQRWKTKRSGPFTVLELPLLDHVVTGVWRSDKKNSEEPWRSLGGAKHHLSHPLTYRRPLWGRVCYDTNSGNVLYSGVATTGKEVYQRIH